MITYRYLAYTFPYPYNGLKLRGRNTSVMEGLCTFYCCNDFAGNAESSYDVVLLGLGPMNTTTEAISVRSVLC